MELGSYFSLNTTKIELAYAKCKNAEEKYGYGHDPLCGRGIPDPYFLHSGNKV
jgi:hypothetical protein